MKYIHKTDVHNLDSPAEVVPIVMDLLSPQSIVDFGCGIGTWISMFKQHGVQDVLGLDGTWVNQDLLNVSRNKFFTFRELVSLFLRYFKKKIF